MTQQRERGTMNIEYRYSTIGFGVTAASDGNVAMGRMS